MISLRSPLLLACFWLGLTSTGYAQTVRDFFQPAAGMNAAIYRFPGYKANQTGETSHFITYGTQGDSILTCYMIEDPDDSAAFNSLTTLSTYSGRRVLVRNVHLRSPGLTESRTCQPAQVLLVLPAAGKVARWEYENVLAERFACSATLTAITYEGKARPAVRVVRRSRTTPGRKVINVYARGLGFYQTTTIDPSGKRYLGPILYKVVWSPVIDSIARAPLRRTSLAPLDTPAPAKESSSDGPASHEPDGIEP